MSEVNFKLKGPVGAVIAVLVVLGFSYYQFFMPLRVTSKDKKVILEKIKEIRMSELSRINEQKMKAFNKTGKYTQDSKDITQLLGTVVIKNIEGKKSLWKSNRVKVIFTVDGKVLEGDAGTLYFKLYRHKRKKSSIRTRVSVTQITEDDYSK